MAITWTQKERTLLEDQMSHEEMCIKKYSLFANQAHDPQLKQICKANELSERTHFDTINQMLNGTIPQMNQGQQNTQQYENLTDTTQVQGTYTDKDICTDILMTEKYVSAAYNTAIFEFRDTQARDALNHIQKEEQKHGEAIYQYMNTKGMYNAQ